MDTSFLKGWEDVEYLWPYALSTSLAWTGKAAGKDLRDSLSEYFTVRSPWTARGIGIPKDQSKWPTKNRLSIEVGAAQDYMRAQAKGAEDHRRPAGKTPIGLVPAAGLRKALGGKLSKRTDWARNLIRQGKAARVTLLSTRREAIVATAKFGHGWREGRPLYFPRLDAETSLDDRWPMNERINATFAKLWKDNTIKGLRNVIQRAGRTARGKSRRR